LFGHVDLPASSVALWGMNDEKDEKVEVVSQGELAQLLATIAESTEKLKEIDLITHYSFAVIKASMLREMLRRAVRSKMRPLSKRKAKELFEGNGPLATNDARIEVAYALKLIDENQLRDLRIINSVRNHFAHTIEDFDNFASPKIVKHLRKSPAFDESTRCFRWL
jgi:DNA-binding MltR family transcriptional regulator